MRIRAIRWRLRRRGGPAWGGTGPAWPEALSHPFRVRRVPQDHRKLSANVRTLAIATFLTMDGGQMQYPLLDAFLTMLWFFLWVLWIFLLFWIIFDVFRSKDLSGWAKALWLIFIVILPFLGVLVYVIARGGSMHERSAREAQAEDKQFREYVRDAAGTKSSTDELAKLADLKERGVITDAEFQQGKAKILA
jgi:ABC-type multidrug transport system fused ATPase/permease subunit